MKPKLTTILSLVVIYFLGFGISYAFVPKTQGNNSLINPSAGQDPVATPKAGKTVVSINPSEPKNQQCPLNGLMYTTTEKNIWDKRRPMAVMIENHKDARPQSGLSSADIVYESVAEGGITRFMGVFYCDSANQDLTLGPVRSARTYFLDWASEYGKYPIYVHVGGANTPNKANALGQIKDYGWGGANDLNQFGLSIKECWRDYNRLGHEAATEHTMYCSSEALLKVAAKRNFTNLDPKGNSWTSFFTPWKFQDGKAASTTSAPASTISFAFMGSYDDYLVKWTYDSTENMYKRENGGEKHIDRNLDQQLKTSTVIVQFETETGPIDEEKHMLYGTTGTGNALIFNGGKVETATWSKKTRLDRTIFKDAKGKEIQFAPGKIWIENLAKTAKVEYN